MLPLALPALARPEDLPDRMNILPQLRDACNSPIAGVLSWAIIHLAAAFSTTTPSSSLPSVLSPAGLPLARALEIASLVRETWSKRLSPPTLPDLPIAAERAAPNFLTAR